MTSLRMSSTITAAASIFLLTLNACGTTDASEESDNSASEADNENANASEADAQSESEAAPESAELSVVASTNVYADLVSGITGDAAEVEALVTSTATDPHSYEATPQDRLKVENADVIIANGAGYDSFITLLASSADKDDAVYQVAEDGEGHSHAHDHDEEDHGHDDDDHGHSHEDDDHGHDDDHDHDHAHEHDHDHAHEHNGEFENEHFWYDLERMQEFVLDVAEHLGEAAPEHAEEFENNAEELAAQIGDLDEQNRGLEASGLTYLATEGVSGFLLEDAGFEDQTDPAFLNAVDHGDDASPRLYNEALDLAADVDLLSYNAQTETQQASRIRDAAEEADTPVVEFKETIPEDAANYIEWMQANIDLIEATIEDLR